MNQQHLIRIAVLLFLITGSNTLLNGQVGIGTNTPKARLHVTDSSVLFSANGAAINTLIPPVPITGEGRRMMWYSPKAAFRAGYVQGSEWNTENIGDYSFAAGYGNRASGYASFAMGSGNTASGSASIALGGAANANGVYSIAIGYQTTSSINHSTALGNFAAANHIGAFVIGDASTTTALSSSSSNQISMRFNSGYRFFTNSLHTEGVSITSNNRMGIGTFSPAARLHIADSSVVFNNSSLAYGTAGNTPVSGTGRRMMWYVDKAAFRAGAVISDQWDSENIGTNSFATGFSTIASATNSIAMGSSTRASGSAAIATGTATIASGNAAFAAGSGTTASGDYSVATGRNTTASGNQSAAFGDESTASGINAFAAIRGNATGNNSLAIGHNATANANNAIAIGSNITTNGYSGAVIIADNSTNNVTESIGNNSFTTRFYGGYRLYTNWWGDAGVLMSPSANSWSSISDSTKKENFTTTNGKEFLQKIAGMKLGSWNYKGQDKNTLRHYGPMAQEFYALFGNDGIGTIGNDTTIASADIDGVMLIAIQALIKENEELKKNNLQLLEANNKQTERLIAIEDNQKQWIAQIAALEAFIKRTEMALISTEKK